MKTLALGCEPVSAAASTVLTGAIRSFVQSIRGPQGLPCAEAPGFEVLDEPQVLAIKSGNCPGWNGSNAQFCAATILSPGCLLGVILDAAGRDGIPIHVGNTSNSDH